MESALLGLGLTILGGLTPIDNVLAHVDHPEIRAVIECESGTRQYRDDGTLMTGAAGEIGIAQFMPSTWATMNKARGVNLDIHNALAQINMMDWAFGRGYASHWTCYNLRHPK